MTYFWAKVFDFYVAAVPAAATASWHPVFVSAGTVSPGLWKLCAQRAVVLVEPEWILLPVRLWMAGRPNADDRLPGPLLAECVRLGAPAVAAMQQRWRLQDDDCIRFDPRWWSSTTLDDLCYMHDELSGAVLDLYDRELPGALERPAVRDGHGSSARRGHAGRFVPWAPRLRRQEPPSRYPVKRRE